MKIIEMLVFLNVIYCLIGCQDETKTNESLKVYPEVKEVNFDSNSNEITLKTDEGKAFWFPGFTAIQGQDTIIQSVGGYMQYEGKGDWFNFKLSEDYIYIKVGKNPNPFSRYLYLKIHYSNDLNVLIVTQSGQEL